MRRRAVSNIASATNATRTLVFEIALFMFVALMAALLVSRPFVTLLQM